MFVSKTLSILAVTALAGESLAFNTHRHGRHQHLHQKKDVATEYVTVTDWVTVTAHGNGGAPTSAPAAPASSSQASSGKAASAPAVHAEAADVPAPAPSATTLATSVVASSSSPSSSSSTSGSAANSVPVHIQAADASNSAGYTSGSTGPKRGLAYNDPSVASLFFAEGNKIGWAYNWGQVNDLKANVEYVPMLWGPTDNFAPTWNANAKKAVAAGSKYMLSFNEPDIASQSNLSPAAAKEAHIKYMNPFRDQARIGSPSISNSNIDGQGISWLTSFISTCAGQCAMDFVSIHWYDAADVDIFLNHVRKVHKAVPDKPIWVTEFAPTGSDQEIDKFVGTITDKLDNDPEFSYVERYSYFMATEGSMLASSTSLSVYGKTFAYH